MQVEMVRQSVLKMKYGAQVDLPVRYDAQKLMDPGL